MGILKKVFKKWTKSKNPDSKQYRWDMARSICGQHIKYVTENRNGVEEVIGRNGDLQDVIYNVRDI